MSFSHEKEFYANHEIMSICKHYLNARKKCRRKNPNLPEPSSRGHMRRVFSPKGSEFFLIGSKVSMTSMIYATARMDTLQEAVDRLELNSGK
jgi:hypothetical protein